jgi:hypothetical protein
MTDTTIAPPARRALTDEQLATEAIARFGEDPRNWAFRCPTCGDTATSLDFPPRHRSRVSAECVGRYVENRGCRREAAAGLVPGPWLVELGDGTIAPSFPLADAPLWTPQDAPQPSDGTGGPETAENPPAALSAPPRTLTVERGSAPEAISQPDGDFSFDPQHWTYRVALDPDHSILGYLDAADQRLCTIFANLTILRFGAFLPLPEKLPTVLDHIAEHGMLITPEDLAEAMLLIENAAHLDAPGYPGFWNALPIPTIPIPSAEYLTGPQGEYWTAKDGWANNHVYGCSCHLSAPCSRCESLDVCEHCTPEVSVPANHMPEHLAEIHPNATDDTQDADA